MIKLLLSVCTLLSISVSIAAQPKLEQVRHFQQRGRATLPDLFYSDLLNSAETPSSLQDLVNRAAKTTIDRFADKKLTKDQLSITLIDMRDPKRPVTASFRGNERVYPASVVKLFYLVATHRWLEDKKIQDTPELRRAMKDMIVDSSNEATQYIVDVLSRSTSGYELPPREMKQWQYRRDAVNRYFTSLG